jgi:hypothetical protein
MLNAFFALLGVLALGCVMLWPFAAWITHIVICIQAQSWLLLIAGAIMFPVGIVHGTGAWFGAW